MQTLLRNDDYSSDKVLRAHYDDITLRNYYCYTITSLLSLITLGDDCLFPFFNLVFMSSIRNCCLHYSWHILMWLVNPDAIYWVVYNMPVSHCVIFDGMLSFRFLFLAFLRTIEMVQGFLPRAGITTVTTHL